MNEPRRIWVLIVVHMDGSQRVDMAGLSFNLDRLKVFATDEFGLDDSEWIHSYGIFMKKSTYGDFVISIYQEDIL